MSKETIVKLLDVLQENMNSSEEKEFPQKPVDPIKTPTWIVIAVLVIFVIYVLER